ncbi:hypothetical protein VTK26DRAFT_3222 [Humicola hyalothermophila]
MVEACPVFPSRAARLHRPVLLGPYFSQTQSAYLGYVHTSPPRTLLLTSANISSPGTGANILPGGSEPSSLGKISSLPSSPFAEDLTSNLNRANARNMYTSLLAKNLPRQLPSSPAKRPPTSAPQQPAVGGDLAGSFGHANHVAANDSRLWLAGHPWNQNRERLGLTRIQCRRNGEPPWSPCHLRGSHGGDGRIEVLNTLDSRGVAQSLQQWPWLALYGQESARLRLPIAMMRLELGLLLQ